MDEVIKYEIPRFWIQYDLTALVDILATAKSNLTSLRTIPYQREWVNELQKMELKREVAGTSQIEGADFTERELQAALEENQTDIRADLFTRSQRQARAAKHTYEWIAQIEHDEPITIDLILEIHRRMVTGADDDHCPPGKLRSSGQNVTFGDPRHRGAEGGPECFNALKEFTESLRREYRDHDPIIQALSAHYHLAAIHPFLDGNGRTARALEALMLQRAGLERTCFIAMSNYYYDEKKNYLLNLSKVREGKFDLTPFLKFSLRGVSIQSERLLIEIKREVSKALFRNLMFDLFERLKTPRKRVIVDRQIEMLKILLDCESIEFNELSKKMSIFYQSLRNPFKAFTRDLNGLMYLKAIKADNKKEKERSIWFFKINLRWPEEFTNEELFQKYKSLPQSKTHFFGV